MVAAPKAAEIAGATVGPSSLGLAMTKMLPVGLPWGSKRSLSTKAWWFASSTTTAPGPQSVATVAETVLVAPSITDT